MKEEHWRSPRQDKGIWRGNEHRKGCEDEAGEIGEEREEISGDWE